MWIRVRAQHYSSSNEIMPVQWPLNVCNRAVAVGLLRLYACELCHLPTSMEIPRLGIQLPEHLTQVHKPLCNQVPYVALALPHTVDAK